MPPVDDKIVVPSDGLNGWSPNENELLLQFNDPGYHAVGVRGQTLFVVVAAKLPFVLLFVAIAAAFCIENAGGVSCAAKSCDTPPLWYLNCGKYVRANGGVDDVVAMTRSTGELFGPPLPI